MTRHDRTRIARLRNIGLHTLSKLASGEEYRYSYDELGNFTDASSKDHQVAQRYVGTRLVEDIRDGDGVEHTFDLQGIIRTALFRRFKVEYANTSRGVTVTTPDGSTHRFWRASNGVLVRENGNGSKEALWFDPHSRLARRSCWRDSARNPYWISHYQYGIDGLLHELVDSEYGITQYSYDADRRIALQNSPAHRSGGTPMSQAPSTYEPGWASPVLDVRDL